MTAAGPGAFEEGPEAKIARLERLLADERAHAVRATRQLHRAMRRDLRAAERRAAAAERRADVAEAELARVRASAAWRAGRAVVAGPAWVRRRWQR